MWLFPCPRSHLPYSAPDPDHMHAVYRPLRPLPPRLLLLTHPMPTLPRAPSLPACSCPPPSGSAPRCPQACARRWRWTAAQCCCSGTAARSTAPSRGPPQRAPTARASSRQSSHRSVAGAPGGGVRAGAGQPNHACARACWQGSGSALPSRPCTGPTWVAHPTMPATRARTHTAPHPTPPPPPHTPGLPVAPHRVVSPQDYCIECPSTGTLFSLKDGSIVSWYPNNPVLRALTPADLCRPLEVGSRPEAAHAVVG